MIRTTPLDNFQNCWPHYWSKLKIFSFPFFQPITCFLDNCLVPRLLNSKSLHPVFKMNLSENFFVESTQNNSTIPGFSQNEITQIYFSPSSSFTWTWQETLLSIPLTGIVLLTILGNFLVLYSIQTRPKTLRNPAHFLIGNLALADFLVGIFAMPFLATMTVTGRWYFGRGYCEAWTDIHTCLCSASILSTLAICVERYIAVGWPLGHRSIMNRRKVWGFSAAVWTSAIGFTLGSLYIWPQPSTGRKFECEPNLQIGFVLVVKLVMLYVPAVVMVILYWRIFVIASKHLQLWKVTGVKNSLSTSGEPSASTSSGCQVTTLSSSGSDIPETKPDATSGSSSKSVPDQPKNYQTTKQIILAKRLTVLVAVLLASYLPYFSMYIVMAFLPDSIDLRVFRFFQWIRYNNSCVNPFIYAFAVPAYRKAIKEIFGSFWGKVRSCKRMCNVAVCVIAFIFGVFIFIIYTIVKYFNHQRTSHRY